MSKKKSIPIADLIYAAHQEMIRLKFSTWTANKYCSEFKAFGIYCGKNGISQFDTEVGTDYFAALYGLDIMNPTLKLTKKQLQVRCAVRFLDDLYEFGYARRYRHHLYKTPAQYALVLNEYLNYCMENGASSGTIDVKRAKLRIFFEFLETRGIALDDVTPSDLSDFIVSLTGYSRSSMHIFTSVLTCFFRYLQENGSIKQELSSMIPKPKIYSEEGIPETWTPEEVQRLLSAIDRTSGIGKRDYAMILLSVILGMRAGDICNLRFSNFDWNRKLITYVQQKTSKSNTLPILPEIGEAIIDYLKNGRLESDCNNVFIKHVAPYGAIAASATLTGNIKRYMKLAGLTVKHRKGSHSLRHTLASSLLRDETPILTISNILGHYNPRATTGYMKVDIEALRRCSLSYGERAVS